MSKPVKDLITKEYQDRYGTLDSACVVSVIGLDGVTANKLRGELATKKIRLQVVKNSLARRAFSEGPLAPLGASLDGPCALVTGGESIIDVAKALIELKRTYPLVELKVGMLAGDPELLSVEQLAKMKSRNELLGEIAMLISSPGRRLAGCLQSPGGKIAGCLKALIEKAEKAEKAEPAPAAPAA
jgi:large subunit ribosomal protein L10